MATRRGGRRRPGGRAASWAMRAPRGDLVVVIVVVVVSLAFAVTVALFPWPGRAAGPSNAAFRPGLVISDAQFYDPDTMTRRQVEDFLRDRPCTPTADAPCLADYRQDTPDRPLSYAHCAAYRGGTGQSAAAIIVDVAQDCRINPRVLLVLLQKEQSLLTRPTASGYQRATGYGCPDTAPCDAEYYGFFNQVYRAAWQFRDYTVDPAVYRYRVGENEIRYHPDAACGAGTVDIQDQATADLYDYTPYQPSPQTLAGIDNACSSYGNLDFWRLYTEWFGSPLSQPFPAGYPACLDLVGGTRCAVDPTTGL